MNHFSKRTLLIATLSLGLASSFNLDAMQPAQPNRQGRLNRNQLQQLIARARQGLDAQRAGMPQNVVREVDAIFVQFRQNNQQNGQLAELAPVEQSNHER